MTDQGVYLEKLTAFVRLLRMQGLSVGPGDAADGARLLTQLGFSDREQVKTALRAVFAKSREVQTVFDRVFDGFFLPEEAMRAQAKEQMERERREMEQRQAARQELEEIGQRVNLSRDQQESYEAMPESARRKLMDFMERYKGNAQRNPSLYGEFIHSVFAKAILEQQMLSEDAAVGCDASDPEMGMMYRSISDFEDREIPRAVALIQAVSRRINAELSARNRTAGHSGKMDFRRTIRLSLETGGVCFRLRYRKKRPKRKRLVVLCDVSGSMMQFSEFALRFIQSLNQMSDNSRVFLFSEKLVEADAFRLQDMDRFREYVRQSGIYGRGTDLGAALESLCRLRPPVLGSSTTLLILSDTKTVDVRKAVGTLEEAKRLTGRVLWLNPIPRGKWRYLRSVQTMAEICTMVPCSTLGELSEACRKLSFS